MQGQKQKVLKSYQFLGKIVGLKKWPYSKKIGFIKVFLYKLCTTLILSCICSNSYAALDYMHYFNKNFKQSLNIFIQTTFVLRYLRIK